MVVKKNCFCIFSILMFGKEAVCPDGLFVPAIFRESDFYLNSLKYSMFCFPPKKLKMSARWEVVRDF